MMNEIYEFNIPGHTTRQEWAVYIIVASSLQDSIKRLYVGKVGDNREGCNPIISRIGNHFSKNRLHSQLRTKIGDPTVYNYRCLYTVFGDYEKANHILIFPKINEMERRLNTILQEKIASSPHWIILNPYRGKGFINQQERERRNSLITEMEIKILNQLAENAISNK